jgi:hypothetical protein
MKSKQPQKDKKAIWRPTQNHWHEMNRKQRREMTRKIQSEDLNLGRASFTHFPHGTAHKNRMQGNDLVPRVMYRRVITCFRARKIRISDLDVEATREVNADRGIDFRLPATPNRACALGVTKKARIH